MSVNPDKLIRQVLMANAGVVAQVGVRAAVWSKQDGWALTDKAIVFRVQGGATDPQTPIKVLSVVFLCFGGSRSVQDARAVSGALEDCLNGAEMVSVSEGVLMSARQELEGQPLEDPETREIYVLTIYELEMRGTD